MSTLSRITPGVNQDNTGRNFAYDYQIPASAAIINIATSQFDTIVMVQNLLVAPTINLSVGTALNPPFVGDQLQIVLPSSVGVTAVLGTGFIASSYTSIIGIGKTNSISLIFNGIGWVEVGRSAGA